MKNVKRILILVLTAALVVVMGMSLAACGKSGPDNLRFAAPEGTPALAIARLVADNKKIGGYEMEYAIVASSSISVEMGSARSDLVIMPVNAGASLIRQGADYKLVSVAVDGSLYVVGKADVEKSLTIDDIKGKKIACIGKQGVPGLVFRYVMAGNNISITETLSGTLDENEVFVQYVADGTAARTLLADDQVDYAVVGEPAATAFKNAIGARAELNMQTAYWAVSGKNTYPQAGLFVRKSIASNSVFMSELFDALAKSKTWVENNASEVTAFAKEFLYNSAAFPAPSIARCALDVTELTETKKSEIVQFLNAVMPKDSNDNDIDWDNASIF